MNLADVCESYECQVEVDRERTQWMVTVQNLKKFYEELDRVYHVLEKAQDEDFLHLEEHALLDQAARIKISIDSDRHTVLESSDPKNPLLERLQETISPFPFIRLGEYGLSLFSCVKIGKDIYELGANQFDNFLREMAKVAYGPVESLYETQDRLKQEGISAKELANLDTFMDGYEDSLATFSRTFPSCGVTIFGPDGTPIIDELDNEVNGRTVCLSKEKPFIRTKRKETFNPRIALGKIFPDQVFGSAHSSRLSRQDLLTAIVKDYKIPLIDFLVNSTGMRYSLLSN